MNQARPWWIATAQSRFFDLVMVKEAEQHTVVEAGLAAVQPRKDVVCLSP
ncbi:MAG: hypothetical protein H0T99_02040 [Geodermatophilaceae bacterium]|nr:hypothetical protein [Geodermatophilaceae bacterium]